MAGESHRALEVEALQLSSHPHVANSDAFTDQAEQQQTQCTSSKGLQIQILLQQYASLLMLQLGKHRGPET